MSVAKWRDGAEHMWEGCVNAEKPRHGAGSQWLICTVPTLGETGALYPPPHPCTIKDIST